MKTCRPDGQSLWDLTVSRGIPVGRFIADGADRIALAGLASGSSPGAVSDVFRGRSVLISCDRQLPAVLAMLALDGIARRILLYPPDLSPVHLAAEIAEAEIDLIVSDGTGPVARPIHGVQVVAPSFSPPSGSRRGATEWLLFTSGTSGRPKIVVHTLESLSGPLDDGLAASDVVWSTFYDVRRYGGLTILFRALLGGASMVLSQPGEAMRDFFIRAGRSRVTHITGTPSHWRRALMSPAVGEIDPDYVRLSGEVADQAILNHLVRAFPRAEVAHAFASTEAGFAFDVRDRMAGFPASLIGQVGGKVELRIKDGSLRVRSTRAASRYLGDGLRLTDADGFVDTGDMVEPRNDRYYFAGRREGIINVGGLKVHPEEVEAVINQHPAVQMARVRGRSSPITGAIVVADIVVRPNSDNSFQAIRDEILATCRDMLPPHKVPAMLRELPELDIAASGKMERRLA
jgi:acyl-CoA synthetase (AMP-forming)/AMP-acid ligase II